MESNDDSLIFMPGPLYPVVRALAQIVSPLSNAIFAAIRGIFHPKLLKIVGFGTAAAFGTWFAALIVLTLLTDILLALGLSTWSDGVARLLVYGAPNSLAGLLALLNTLPGVTAAVGGAVGAFFGATR